MAAAEGGGREPGGQGAGAGRQGEEEAEEQGVEAEEGESGGQPPGAGGAKVRMWISAANRLIGEVVQSRRRPLLGPSPG